jgi:chromate transporter
VSEPAPLPSQVPLTTIFRTFLLIGATSFGGGVVAYLREVLVRGRRWLDDDSFLAALEIGQTIPGLMAVNLSIIVGDRLRGLSGALVAFLGMTIPGTLVVMALGILYGEHGRNPAITEILQGVAAAAVGLLLFVTLEIGRKAVRNVTDVAIAVVTCLSISVLHVSLVAVLVVVGPLAVWLYRPRRAAPQVRS